MRTYYLFFALLISGFSGFTQSPQVPSKLQFADIVLKIDNKAKAMIQKDVDLLTRSPKYFEIKAERARTYFPIIERIFREEGVPDSFKYLVIQESALIADAVSSAQAVGFWQMKDFTALELGLRVDRYVDERLNIVSSTYAATKYFKKANGVFDNWLNALQSYQMGIGGATRKLGDQDKGKKLMTITPNTYWYVRKFLAHMIAFQGVTEKASLKPVSEFKYTGGKTFSDISRETKVDENEIQELNKWLLKGKIPADRNYTVLLPGEYIPVQDQIAEQNTKVKPLEKSNLHLPNSLSDFFDNKHKDHKYIVGINGLPGIIASNTDNSATLATKGEIPLSKFLEYNDLSPNTALIPGQVYYLKRKKRKAKIHFHTVEEGQTLWLISQKYGVRMDKIIGKNRISSAKEIRPGRVLWLRNIRPQKTAAEYVKIEKSMSENKNIVAQNTKTTSSPKEELPKMNTNQTPESSSNFEYNEITPIEKEWQEEEEEITIEYSSAGKKQVLHRVIKGDTYYSVSAKYNVPVPALLQWNERKITDTIYIGDILTVYVRKDLSDFKTHEVKPGDTMYSISVEYGVSVDQILKWNEKVDYHLKVGEVIKIKN